MSVRNKLTLIDKIILTVPIPWQSSRRGRDAHRVQLEMCTDSDYPLLLELRRECPDTRVTLLADDLIEEDRLMHALTFGARGLALTFPLAEY